MKSLSQNIVEHAKRLYPKALIAGYVERHPLIEECGSEYIWQNDEAQEDAIQLVADIFDNMES